MQIASRSLPRRNCGLALRGTGPRQRQAIEGFAEQRGAGLIARFTEVESGRNPDRPELGKALHLAKVTGATLVIAKLDRLSRNAAFLLTLRDSGVRFAAVDLPEANDLTVGIMALVAQQEREAISRRTKEVLAVARDRGVRLSNPNGAASLRRSGKGGAPSGRRSGATPTGMRRTWRRWLRTSVPAGRAASARLPTNSTPAACSPDAAGAGTSQR